MPYDYIKPQHYKSADGKDTIQRIEEKDGAYIATRFCYGNITKYRDRQGKKPGIPAEQDNQKANEYFFRATLITREQPKWRLWYWRNVLRYLVKL